MKKVIEIALLIVVALALFGCPQPNDSGNGGGGGGSNTGVNVGSLTLDDVKAIVNSSSYDGQSGIDDIRTLLTGDDIDAQDSQGSTALIIASYSNLTDIAIALINARADVNHQKHHYGGVEVGANVAETALHFASDEGNLLLVRALIEAGATVEVIVIPGGETALYNAIFRNLPDVLEVLIAEGANIDYIAPSGPNINMSMLMLAIHPSKIEILRLLIEARVNTAHVYNGKTALDIAREKATAAGDGSYDEIIALLEEASA